MGPGDVEREEVLLDREPNSGIEVSEGWPAGWMIDHAMIVMNVSTRYK